MFLHSPAGRVGLITDVVDFARSPLKQGILANPTTNPSVIQSRVGRLSDLERASANTWTSFTCAALPLASLAPSRKWEGSYFKTILFPGMFSSNLFLL